MLFYVHAQDRPAVEGALYDLAEPHWSYMDEYADRLVLRGPTLSEDGEEHTGSVHVVDVPDRAAAERFATEEPYWRAGLYGDIATVRTVVLLQRDRADDPSVAGEPAPLSLVTGDWPPEADAAPDLLPQDSSLRYLATLVDDDGSRTTGIVAVVAALPDEALKTVQSLAEHYTSEPATLTAQRWCRGGRS